MMFNLFKKNVNMKEVGQNKALTWSCYGAKSRITSIMEGKWSDNGTIVCSDWCGHSMAYGRLAGVTGTALRKIAAVFCLLMAVGVSDVWGEDYTFSAGTTIYYDFRDLTGAAGVNWWKGGSDLAYFVGIGKGCVVAYTFPDEKTATIGSTVLFKTQNNSYNPITISSAPTSGENVVKVSADGTSYTWAQASARTFASGDTIFLKDTWDDDGNDANWGRILCALGYSGAKFDPEIVDIYFESEAGKIQIVENGVATDYSEEEATRILNMDAVRTICDMKMGDAMATAYGCDLTYDYVKINADYRS